ncbi:SpoU-methylase domain-containing protein [Sulfidibacter corallicola]|uniref:tRNA/rRNA methyltransferase SpoU type domain-containing protein n=1 Tax=Sulfidibacter corallicola TaxID=2818388 RepID=A0A8A4TUM3_SULCO|nr:TrmH family RNA methyltransferase [Sulfidibacter corallicola]QTD53666.1 hypothetical protein J3U87_14525 [Sulfidibacter corallicola]
MNEPAFRFKLIVFNIEKENNVGMLSRSAYAFGCDELLIVGRQRVKSTGAQGTFQFLSWRHFYTLADAVAYCRQQAFQVWGVEIGGACITQTTFDRDIAFVLGNEGRGLADAAPFCDHLISIPQWGGVPSLNVAVAGGIVMFQFQRAQGLPPAARSGERYVDDNFPESMT